MPALRVGADVAQVGRDPRPLPPIAVALQAIALAFEDRRPRLASPGFTDAVSNAFMFRT